MYVCVCLCDIFVLVNVQTYYDTYAKVKAQPWKVNSVLSPSCGFQGSTSGSLPWVTSTLARWVSFLALLLRVYHHRLVLSVLRFQLKIYITCCFLKNLLCLHICISCLHLCAPCVCLVLLEPEDGIRSPVLKLKLQLWAAMEQNPGPLWEQHVFLPPSHLCNPKPGLFWNRYILKATILKTNIFFSCITITKLSILLWCH